MRFFEKWDLEYSVIGKVNTSGKYSVTSNGSIIYEKDISTFEGVNQDWPTIKILTIRKNIINIIMMKTFGIYMIQQ